MKKMGNLIITAGIIFLLIFLAGCTSSASSNDASAPTVGVVQIVGPTPTPVPHTIVGSWKVDSNGHKGTVDFTPNGYVSIDVNGYPGILTGYTDEGNNMYSASYFIYSIQFQYNPSSDTVTSQQYTGIILTRLS